MIPYIIQINDCSLYKLIMAHTLDAFGCSECTSPSNQTNKSIKKMISASFYIMLVIICLLIPNIEAKQTVLAESLATKNDKILVQLLQETHNYIEYDRIISSTLFKCKNILKNQLTKNAPENITKLNLPLDYGQVLSFSKKEALQGQDQSHMEQIRQIDKIMDIVKGQCLYYSTNTFIYEYCHKEHVRQFDNPYTKAINGKPEYEDIDMGVYNPEQHKKRKAKKGLKELTEQERKVTIPQLSNFQREHNFLFIQDIDNKYGKLELEESQDGRVLFSNVHLTLNDRYYMLTPLILKLICEQKPNNSYIKEIVNYALVIDPNTLVYVNKQGTCDKYIDHQILPQQIEYFQDASDEPIRVYGRYLYGNVQEVCSRKWAWQRSQSQPDFGNHIEVGSLIFIELYNKKEQQTEYHNATVKKVLSPYLIELQTPLGKSFKTSYHFIDSSTIKSTRSINNITKCQLMFKKELDFKKPVNFSYLGNGVVKVGSQEVVIEAGDNIGCLCKSSIKDNFHMIDLDITISKYLWLNYYESFILSNTNIYSTSAYNGKQYLLKQCHEYTCFSFVKNNQKDSQYHQEKPNKFTEIIKLSSNKNNFIFNSSLNSLYILTIKGNGIIKLITRSKNGLIYTYLITQGQIIKMIEFANGTKEIIKQNKYYENLTQPSPEINKNYIYIRVDRLPNGSYYGGIWKTRDLTYFPRFLLFDQEIISLQRKSGYAYIRILHLDNLRNKQHMAVIKYMKRLEAYYSMKEKLEANPEESLFLNKSYSINYVYVGGKYCPAPVNKFRRTIVNIKCGKPWFAITKLHETSPCEYWIQIQTTLLCRQGYKQVAQSDDSLFNRNGDDVVISNGVFCHPTEGLLDEVSPYLYLQQETVEMIDL